MKKGQGQKLGKLFRAEKRLCEAPRTVKNLKCSQDRNNFCSAGEDSL